MPDLRDIYYHGVRQNLRRVLDALGPERIDKGLTAFEDGASNWSECFFARALDGELDLRECRVVPNHPAGGKLAAVQSVAIADYLGLPSYVPVQMTWNFFDNIGRDSLLMTRADLRKFIEDVRDESRPSEVMSIIRAAAPAEEEVV